MKQILFTILFVVISITLFAQQKVQVRCISFYNLENLFDTIIDPDTNLVLREEFTPQGKKNWNTERYYKKLDNMARVISEIGTDITPAGASIIGVSEIENRDVLVDLVNRPSIIHRNYQIVHYDSPDERGVDVGFLYQPDAFELQKSWVRHETGLPHNDKTRDLLIMEGELDGEKMYFMVNHWPSRSGGQKKSAPKRDSVAKHDRQTIDSILKKNPTAKIIYMGDLNDDPIDESVKTHLNTNGNLKKIKEQELYNPYLEKFKTGNGTLAYHDAWNLFDQIIITQSLLGKNKSTYKFEAARIFKKKYMLQNSGRFKGYPLRTFVGSNFKGGYSDHFPVYIFITRKPKKN